MEPPVTTTIRGGSPGAFSKPLPQSKLRNIKGAFSKPLLQNKLAEFRNRQSNRVYHNVHKFLKLPN